MYVYKAMHILKRIPHAIHESRAEDTMGKLNEKTSKQPFGCLTGHFSNKFPQQHKAIVEIYKNSTYFTPFFKEELKKVQPVIAEMIAPIRSSVIG